MRSSFISVLATERRCEHLRALKREHMRRWRAIPANRAHEQAQQRESLVEKKLKILAMCSEGELCGFCYRRHSIARVERLFTTNSGFRRIFVPYCGVC